MAYLELGSPTLHRVDVLLQALLGMERGGSKARTPWLSQDPTSRLQALGEPKPAPPGPSPPQHRSPAVQRSSSASPCPAPSACEHQPSGPLSHPCPGGAAVSGTPQHEVPTPPRPADGGPGWRKLLGEGKGPRLPSATRSVEEPPQPVALGTGWPWPWGAVVSHFVCQLLQLCGQIQEASLGHVLIQLEKAETEP